MNEEKGEPIYINAEAMLQNKSSPTAYGAAMDLITLVWWPTKTPFDYNEAALASTLSKQLPARGYTKEKFINNKKEIQSFFTVLPDGRWAPSPEYISINDANNELP